MSYTTTISGIDLSGGVRDVRVVAGYTWVVAGDRFEHRSDDRPLDIPSLDFASQTPVPFTYEVDLSPSPYPPWFVALWIQEIPTRAPVPAGWLFRSGRFTTEPPAAPIEIVLAPEILVGATELTTAAGTLPITSGSLTITSLTLSIAGHDVLATVVGADTAPAGVTFTFTGLIVLSPSDSLQHPDELFEVSLIQPSISPLAAMPIDTVSGIVKAIVRNAISAAVTKGTLTAVASSLVRETPSTMPDLPSGMMLSIRRLHGTTRTAAGTSEPVIGIFAALGAFGSVRDKFPVSPARGGSCVIATAATSPQAPEVMILKAWRDRWLRQRRGGARLIKAYERHSPVLARFIARSDRRRALARVLIVAPAAQLARWLLKRAGIQDGSAP